VGSSLTRPTQFHLHFLDSASKGLLPPEQCLTQFWVIAAEVGLSTVRRMIAELPPYVSLADHRLPLEGERRNGTDPDPGFPTALDIGPRSLRWLAEELAAWEQG
jgi:hypothetical protein